MDWYKSDGSQEDWIEQNASSHRVILLPNFQAFCGVRCFDLDAHLFGQHRITYFGQAKLHGIIGWGKKLDEIFLGQ